MQLKNKMWLRAEKRDFGAFIALAFVNDDRDFAGTNMELKKLEEHEPIPFLLNLDLTGAQRLIDDLWNCGLRPSEGSGSAGALEAVEYHLEDMRKIVISPSSGIFPDEYSPPGLDEFTKKEDDDAGT